MGLSKGTEGLIIIRGCKYHGRRLLGEDFFVCAILRPSGIARRTVHPVEGKKPLRPFKGLLAQGNGE
ncbi:hypothetical protein A6E32_04400 [Chlamydia trachomatis]|nr:hypothetical protein E150_04270 [Chlamydia trachomatis E/150]ADH21295.1 hypothetical protein E11023_04235 [Chlamydia trachomatis E/11023]AGT66774.1 hypothetical protein O172_04455 [Chlamydia trachomatis]AGT67702.1 hypothetical protein O173_04465 [Chlamydia trachomatis F/11-96]AGT68623.1 hypothetical protein O175_04470 [Chlamydia trachomatis]